MRSLALHTSKNKLQPGVSKNGKWRQLIEILCQKVVLKSFKKQRYFRNDEEFFTKFPWQIDQTKWIH